MSYEAKILEKRWTLSCRGNGARRSSTYLVQELALQQAESESCYELFEIVLLLKLASHCVTSVSVRKRENLENPNRQDLGGGLE